jgi:hypothetical protein
VHAYGVYSLPFGKNHWGGGNFLVRALASDWQLSSVYTYASGTAVQITYGGCSAPLQGQCMPDINPAFTGTSARINGSYGSGPNGRTACNLGVGTNCTAVKYFDTNGFSAPTNVNAAIATLAPITLIGNAPRTAALKLFNPGGQNIDTSLRRTIKLHEAMALQIEADCFNTWNHNIFAGPSGVFGSAAFGTITSVSNKPRAFQLAGHFNF